MANCKSCGKKIFFARVPSGKMTPFDFKPRRVFLIGEGEYMRPTEGYVTHFATCPEADKFRKKGGRQSGKV